MKEINCLICSTALTVSVATGRKSNKPFIMLKCPKDGRHFRGFITDQAYVSKVLKDKAELDLSAKGLGTERGTER